MGGHLFSLLEPWDVSLRILNSSPELGANPAEGTPVMLGFDSGLISADGLFAQSNALVRGWL